MVKATAAAPAPKNTTAALASAPALDEAGNPISTVPDGHGDSVTVPDAALNTPEDPHTANGDVARKLAGVSASATAEQVLANGGVDTTDHSLAATSRPDVPAQPDSSTVAAGATGTPSDVRVLADVTIAGVRYLSNDVIEGLPASLVEQHAEAVDAHPDAVAYARTLGMPAKPFAA